MIKHNTSHVMFTIREDLNFQARDIWYMLTIKDNTRSGIPVIKLFFW